jgi:hypothetical protein
MARLNIFAGQAVFDGTARDPWKMIATCPSVIVVDGTRRVLVYDGSADCEGGATGYRWLMDGRKFIVYRQVSIVLGGLSQDAPEVAAAALTQLGAWGCSKAGVSAPSSSAVAWIVVAAKLRHIDSGAVRVDRHTLFTTACGERSGSSVPALTYEELMSADP